MTATAPRNPMMRMTGISEPDVATLTEIAGSCEDFRPDQSTNLRVGSILSPFRTLARFRFGLGDAESNRHVYVSSSGAAIVSWAAVRDERLPGTDAGPLFPNTRPPTNLTGRRLSGSGMTSAYSTLAASASASASVNTVACPSVQAYQSKLSRYGLNSR